MKMDLKSMLAALLVALCLGVVVPACAQATITDMATCEKFSLNCGRSFSQKYCCFELNGPYPIHTCCNPYIGLAAGLCVGIPLVAALIIIVIITYCWCTRYHNRKMDQLMIAYRRQQQEEDEEDGQSDEETNPAAPPAYTPVAKSDANNPEAGLPLYTESDPFAPKVDEENQPSSTSESVQPVQQISETSQTGNESQLDDVPLLSDGETA